MAVAKKQTVVFVLIDGLADVSLHELGLKTPLEAARTPAMDAIARTSSVFCVCLEGGGKRKCRELRCAVWFSNG